MTFLALPFPAVHPNALEFGPFTIGSMVLGPLAIRWYALAYVAGILIGWFFLRRLVARDRLWGTLGRPSGLELDDFVLWATLGIVLGGRLGYVLFYNPSHYLANPSEIPMVWMGGMSFHGGFLGVVAAVALFTRGRTFSFLTLFDLVAAAAPIGLFFGRIANFINAELWGRVSDVPWAMVFPFAGPNPRHPSQLYEAVLEGVVLFAILGHLAWRTDLLKRPGVIAGLFAIGYGVARFAVEFFREPDAQLGYVAGFLTMGQILSLPMIGIGAALALWAWRRSRREVVA